MAIRMTASSVPDLRDHRPQTETPPTSASVATVTDLSAAVATREALTHERQFVDTVLDLAGSLICVIDPDGRFLRFNRACERLSGYTLDEIRDRPFYDFLVPADEVEAVRTALGQLKAGEPPMSNINRWITRDGALRLIAWSDVSFFDEGGSLTHIVSTGTDITDERRAQEALRGIEAVGTLLAKHGPTPDAMAAVLRTLVDGMGYPHLAVYLRDGERLRLGAQFGYAGISEEFDPNAGIIGRVFRTGEAAFVPDVSAESDYVVGHADVMSEIAVALTEEGRAIGVLSIESTREAPLTSADLRLAQTVAERLSAALMLGREQHALADRVRLFTAVTAFAQAANATLGSERLMPALLEALGAVLPADVLALVVVDRASGRYIVRAVSGDLDIAALGTEIPVGEGISGRAIESRTPVFDRVERSRYAKGLHELVSADSLSTAAIPLIRDGAMLGAIVVGRAADREPAFTSLECEVLDLLAAQTALAIANAHLLEEVSELAIHDGLTGLYNRRHLDTSTDRILRERARAGGVRLPLAAILFDLDHFGRFNKEHGHQAGDVVLQAFAKILLGRFRSTDLVARYGGEEFVAILEGTTIEDAWTVADEVRASLAAASIQGPDGALLRATVSAGCALLEDADPTREALFRATEVGLFAAKRNGRNQVVAA